MKKDIDFNYKIIMDIMYLDKKPIFYTIDTTIIFQADRFLNNMLAKKIWEALRQCWINAYLCLIDIVTQDVSTNSDFTEFYTKAKMLSFMCYQIFIEIHLLIRKVEKYYILMHCVYNIIQVET